MPCAPGGQYKDRVGSKSAPTWHFLLRWRRFRRPKLTDGEHVAEAALPVLLTGVRTV